MESTESKLQVYIRIRPDQTQTLSTTSTTITHLNKTYNFNHIFNPSTQSSIFEKTTIPLLNLVKNGYNATLFAYGQTSTGKTYTISGSNSDLGIIQRSIEYLSLNENVNLKISYFEGLLI